MLRFIGIGAWLLNSLAIALLIFSVLLVPLNGSWGQTGINAPCPGTNACQTNCTLQPRCSGNLTGCNFNNTCLGCWCCRNVAARQCECVNANRNCQP